MPRKIPVTQETVAWLANAVDSQMPLDRMAAHVGCCLDTLKRILMRHELMEFSGAKYIPSRRHRAAFWERRCLTCRTIKKLPRNKFMCLECKVRHGVADSEEMPV
jgi:hypothetical protein